MGEEMDFEWFIQMEEEEEEDDDDWDDDDDDDDDDDEDEELQFSARKTVFSITFC